MNHKLEITIETERVVIISRRLLQGWCARCGRQVQLVRLAPEALENSAATNLLRAAACGRLHLTEPPVEAFVLCLDSLLKNFEE